MRILHVPAMILTAIFTALSVGCAMVGEPAPRESNVTKQQNSSREATAIQTDHEAESEVKVGDTVYLFRWVAPEHLAETPLHELGTCDLRAPHSGRPVIYADHVDPLYNIHWRILPGWTMPEVEKARGQRAWSAYWRDLAEDLASKVRHFALVAYADGRQAGQVRFFSDGLPQLDRAADGPGRPAEGETLLVSGVVDLAGADDGLDAELLRRVVAYAREEGYAKVSGLGISNVAPYAMWAEQFMLAAYRAAGFRRVQAVDPVIPGLKDMLAGNHGKDVQTIVKEALATGITVDEANTFYTMEVDFKTD